MHQTSGFGSSVARVVAIYAVAMLAVLTAGVAVVFVHRAVLSDMMLSLGWWPGVFEGVLLASFAIGVASARWPATVRWTGTSMRVRMGLLVPAVELPEAAVLAHHERWGGARGLRVSILSGPRGSVLGSYPVWTLGTLEFPGAHQPTANARPRDNATELTRVVLAAGHARTRRILGLGVVAVLPCALLGGDGVVPLLVSLATLCACCCYHMLRARSMRPTWVIGDEVQAGGARFPRGALHASVTHRTSPIYGSWREDWLEVSLRLRGKEVARFAAPHEWPLLSSLVADAPTAYRS